MLVAIPPTVVVDLLSSEDSELSYNRWQMWKDDTPLHSYLKL